MDEYEIARSLGRLEGKCDSILVALDRGEQRMTRSEVRADGHGARIRKLEYWRWLVIGGAGAIAYVIRLVLP